MHPHHIAMLEAIKSKRGKGLDVHVLMGEKPQDAGKTGEMAPDAAPIDEHMPMDKEGMLQKMMMDEESNESPSEKTSELTHPEAEQAEHDQMKKSLQSSSDQEMMKHMGSHDEMPSHKPRSIGERAKAALMMRMKK